MQPTPIWHFRLQKTYGVRFKKSFVRIPHSKPNAQKQTPVFASLYRGGTSRAILIQPQDLPANRATWPRVIHEIARPYALHATSLLHPETAISRLSKICLVEPAYTKLAPYSRRKRETDDPVEQAVAVTAARDNSGIDTGRQETYFEPQVGGAENAQATASLDQWADVDYTMVDCDVESGELDVAGNCGDIASAIGPYAYNARLLRPELYKIKDGLIRLRLRNTNTGKLINSTFSAVGGQAAVGGNYRVDGVAGKATVIKLHFKLPSGSQTGKAFPTGRKINTVNGFKVTCVDGATPVVFVRADAVRIPGTILPHEFNRLLWGHELDLLESIRRTAAVTMGMASTEDEVHRTLPMIALVSQTAEHEVLTGRTFKPSQADILVRFLSDGRAHPAIPLAGAVTTALAARVPGTVVEQVLMPDYNPEGPLTIGHASGRVEVEVDMTVQKLISVKSALVQSTAERLFEGKVFWTDTSSDADGLSEAKALVLGLGKKFIQDLTSQKASQNPTALNLKSRGESEETSLSEQDLPEDPLPDVKSTEPLLDQDPTYLLRELSALKSSLDNFSTIFPSSTSAVPFPQRAKPKAPTASNISHELSAISHHVSILAKSLSSLPTPAAEKGKSWHKWAQSFSRWRPVRRLREEDRKRQRLAKSKPKRMRVLDSKLNVLDESGEFEREGYTREKLLRERDAGKLKLKKRSAERRARGTGTGMY